MSNWVWICCSSPGGDLVHVFKVEFIFFRISVGRKKLLLFISSLTNIFRGITICFLSLHLLKLIIGGVWGMYVG